MLDFGDFVAIHLDGATVIDHDIGCQLVVCRHVVVVVVQVAVDLCGRVGMFTISSVM